MSARSLRGELTVALLALERRRDRVVALGADLDIVHGVDPSATFHGLDLRMRSAVLPEVDDRSFVPFRQGVGRTVQAMRSGRPDAAAHGSPDTQQ